MSVWLALAASAALCGGAVSPAGAAPAASPSSLDVAGATRIEYDDAARQWSFRGARVVVTRGTTRVEAPEILYAERTREVTLPAGGFVATPALEVRADWIVTNLSSRHLTAQGHVAGRFTDEDASPAERAAPEGWGTFAAEHVELDDSDALRQIVATGQVVVVRGDRRLSGDRVAYNHGTRQGSVDGHAEMTRGSDRLRAGHVFVDLGRSTAEADDHVLLDHGDMHGSADHATYGEAEQRAVLSGHVTLLQGGDTMKADLATVLLDRDTAIAEGHVEIVANPSGGTP